MARLSRRQFVGGAGTAGLGLLAGCGRLPWQAQRQPPERLPRIGFLSAGSWEANKATIEAFLQGLADHGYQEGQNITVEWRFAYGTYDRMPDLAVELVRL